MSKILNFFSLNKAVSIMTLLLLIAILLFLRQCNNNQVLKKKLEVAEQNVQAAQDTIRLVKDKVGKDEFDKLAFWTDKVNNLDKLNKDLAAEVKTLKGKVATIIKGTIKIIHDTIPVPVPTTGAVIDSIVRVDFKYNTVFSPGNFRDLEGFTTYNLANKQSEGVLVKDDFSLKFTTGIKNLDKGKPEIFIKSDYPGFTVSDLEGAVLDPQLFKSKSKAHLIRAGINVGWVPLFYNGSTKKFTFDINSFGAGLGININILKLLKPN